VSGSEPAAAPAERSAETARRALQRLTLSGALRTVDAAFADLLRRLGAGPEVALAGALAMRAVAQGDSGFALTRAEALLAALDASATLPDPEAWRQALRASRWVALSVAQDLSTDTGGKEDAETDAAAARPSRAAESHPPLLVFEHDRVALLRYARFEHDLARRLLRRHAESGTESAESKESRWESTRESRTRESRTPIGSTPPPDTHLQTLARLRRLFALPGADGGSDPATAPASAAASLPLDRQALAAWVALRRRLLLLTGGPGTGKTTTVARLLALAVEGARAWGRPAPRIALAAPTGRAAARLAEAVAAQLARDLADGRLDSALSEAVPRQASTLHRLLGVRLGTPGFHHHPQRPLPFDLVVVDEASMIDLPLMDRLVAAVAPEARLVLIGDPDQLPAVEAGDVLGALCAAAGEGLAVAAEDAEAATRALGVPVPALSQGLPGAERTVGVPVPGGAAHDDAAAPVPDRKVGVPVPVPLPVLPETVGVPVLPDVLLPLAGARVQLVHGWRQAGAAPLQAFAAAVRAGDADGALALLPTRTAASIDPAGDTSAPRARLGAHDDGIDGDGADIDGRDAPVAVLQRLHGDPAALAAWLRAWAMPVFAAVRDADSAEEALALAQRLRLLTALRRGPYGADTWNAWCAAELGARGRWFHGALIAIAANSRHHGLYNGDLGVVRRDRDQGLQAWFALQEAGGEIRWRCWRPAQLPAHDLAFATTVHKAQGSEFERVALILPERDSRALGRELLYTAATRARSRLWLWAAPERVREAIARPAMRDSGLLARLRAGG